VVGMTLRGAPVGSRSSAISLAVTVLPELAGPSRLRIGWSWKLAFLAGFMAARIQSRRVFQSVSCWGPSRRRSFRKVWRASDWGSDSGVGEAVLDGIVEEVGFGGLEGPAFGGDGDVTASARVEGVDHGGLGVTGEMVVTGDLAVIVGFGNRLMVEGIPGSANVDGEGRGAGTGDDGSGGVGPEGFADVAGGWRRVVDGGLVLGEPGFDEAGFESMGGEVEARDRGSEEELSGLGGYCSGGAVAQDFSS